MGHFCKICGRSRPNEAFSGGGHKNHICKKCQLMPLARRNAIEQQNEISGFLHQSHISTKNIKRLELLKTSPDPKTAALAAHVLEVAKIYPYKRQRHKYLARQRRDLLWQMEETDENWPG